MHVYAHACERTCECTYTHTQTTPEKEVIAMLEVSAIGAFAPGHYLLP